MAKTVRKSILLDEYTMDCLDWLSFISNEKKTAILRRLLRLMRQVANNYMKGTEIAVKIEDSRIIIDFYGESRTALRIEKVTGEPKTVIDKVIKIKGEL